MSWFGIWVSWSHHISVGYPIHLGRSPCLPPQPKKTVPAARNCRIHPVQPHARRSSAWGTKWNLPRGSNWRQELRLQVIAGAFALPRKKLKCKVPLKKIGTVNYLWIFLGGCCNLWCLEIFWIINAPDATHMQILYIYMYPHYLQEDCWVSYPELWIKSVRFT